MPSNTLRRRVNLRKNATPQRKRQSGGGDTGTAVNATTAAATAAASNAAAAVQAAQTQYSQLLAKQASYKSLDNSALAAVTQATSEQALAKKALEEAQSAKSTANSELAAAQDVKVKANTTAAEKQKNYSTALLDEQTAKGDLNAKAAIAAAAQAVSDYQNTIVKSAEETVAKTTAAVTDILLLPARKAAAAFASAAFLRPVPNTVTVTPGIPAATVLPQCKNLGRPSDDWSSRYFTSFECIDTLGGVLTLDGRCITGVTATEQVSGACTAPSVATVDLKCVNPASGTNLSETCKDLNKYDFLTADTKNAANLGIADVARAIMVPAEAYAAQVATTPAPTATVPGIIQGVPPTGSLPQCKYLGRPSADWLSRLYNATDCALLGGTYTAATNKCVLNGSDLSVDCQPLNKYTFYTDATKVAIQTTAAASAHAQIAITKPPPTNFSITNAVPPTNVVPQCKYLGRPSDDWTKRIYTESECDALGGTFAAADGTCGALSATCAELNKYSFNSAATADIIAATNISLTNALVTPAVAHATIAALNPPPTTMTIAAGAPPTGFLPKCRYLGKPSNDFASRLYNSSECTLLDINANVDANGVCTAGSTNYSDICKDLNKYDFDIPGVTNSSAAAARKAALNPPTAVGIEQAKSFAKAKALYKVPTGFTITAGPPPPAVLPQCKYLGAPSDDWQTRIYTSLDCFKLGGTYSANGKCLVNGVDFGPACKDLNKYDFVNPDTSAAATEAKNAAVASLTTPAAAFAAAGTPPSPATIKGGPPPIFLAPSCKWLGKPSADWTKRIYLSTECDTLGGVWQSLPTVQGSCAVGTAAATQKTQTECTSAGGTWTAPAGTYGTCIGGTTTTGTTSAISSWSDTCAVLNVYNFVAPTQAGGRRRKTQRNGYRSAKKTYRQRKAERKLNKRK